MSSNFKADAMNPSVFIGLQPRMTLKSRKLEGGKAAARNSIQQSHMARFSALFSEILAPFPSLFRKARRISVKAARRAGFCRGE